jgi:hypothetical protein
MLNLPGDPGDKPLLKRPCVSAPGCASRLCRQLPLGCHGHARGLKRCRVGDGRGTAPGDPCDASQMRFARVMGTEEWVKETR